MRQAAIGFNVYLADHNQWIPRFWNTNYNLIVPASLLPPGPPTPAGIQNFNYVDTVTPSNLRQCPTYDFKVPFPPYVPGAPGGIGVEYQWSYTLPLLDSEWAGGNGQQIYPYTGFMMNRVNTEGGNAHPYLHLVPGVTTYASGVDGGWNVTATNSGTSDPLSSFPLIADRNSYSVGTDMQVLTHQANGGDSNSIPITVNFTTPTTVTGGNTGWLDGHVEWHDMDAANVTWRPYNRTGDAIAAMYGGGPMLTGIDGWTWSTNPSASGNNNLFWIKGVLR